MQFLPTIGSLKSTWDAEEGKHAMLPPYLPASRKIARAAPVRTRQGMAKGNAGIAGAKLELKQPLRVIGSKSEPAIAAMRKKGSRLC